MLNNNIQLFRYFEKLYTFNLLSTKVIFRIPTHGIVHRVFIDYRYLAFF